VGSLSEVRSGISFTQVSFRGEKYLPDCYEETTKRIDRRKYLVVHRRNNECKWKICDDVIGVLKKNQALSEKSFLLSHQGMSAVNHTTAKLFRPCGKMV
jgi:hypothetical protein